MKNLIFVLVAIFNVNAFAASGANPDTAACRSVCQKAYQTMNDNIPSVVKVMDLINGHYGRGRDITTPFQGETFVVYGEISKFYGGGLYEQQMIHVHCFHGAIPGYGANTNQIAFVSWLAKNKPALANRIIDQCK